MQGASPHLAERREGRSVQMMAKEENKRRRKAGQLTFMAKEVQPMAKVDRDINKQLARARLTSSAQYYP